MGVCGHSVLHHRTSPPLVQLLIFFDSIPQELDEKHFETNNTGKLFLSIIGQLGLVEALKGLCQKFRARGLRLKLRLKPRPLKFALRSALRRSLDLSLQLCNVSLPLVPFNQTKVTNFVGCFHVGMFKACLLIYIFVSVFLINLMFLS